MEMILRHFLFAVALHINCNVYGHQQQQYQPPAQHQHQHQQQQQQQYDPADVRVVEGHHQDRQRLSKQVHDQKHIEEHLEDIAKKPTSQMTKQELEFHYFKLHDYDNNNKLDGTEITKAITHYQREEHQHSGGETKTMSDNDITNIVDAVLQEDDLNNDGYIEYAEFVIAQKKARDNISQDAQPPGH